jgi:hypothetical protein
VRTAVLVPRREDQGRRDRLWAHVKDRWQAAGHAVHEGHHGADEGPFNRSAAINRAAASAGDWDVAVVADSDTICPLHQVEQAVALAAASDQIVFGFERFQALSWEMTDRVLDGYDGDWLPGVVDTQPHSCSSCVVVPRPLWDDVGGFDEGFVGWSFEDVGFSLACQAVRGGYGRFGRIAGDVWHLAHDPAPATGDAGHPFYVANHARMLRYIPAIEASDPAAAMRQLLADLRA